MNQSYIVIGGDGFLGRSIAETLKKAGNKVITTSRKKQNISDSCIYLDLKDDISLWEVQENFDAAFFCAAVTSIEECRIHPNETGIVNVENTISLAAKLLRKDVFIIFPSTNLVFDGQSPNRKVNDLVCPCVEYGRQKAVVEKWLSDTGQNVSIVRFTKILGSQTVLINKWIEQLKNKIAIHPFSDMLLAPIPIDFASKVMIETADKKRSGIWHVSAKEDITYEQLARHIARKAGADQAYVQPVKAKGSGSEFESIPKHTTLDTSATEKEFGFIHPDVWDTIDSLFGLKNR